MPSFYRRIADRIAKWSDPYRTRKKTDDVALKNEGDSVIDIPPESTSLITSTNISTRQILDLTPL